MMYPKLSSPPVIESILRLRFVEVITEEQINAFCSNEDLTSLYNTIDDSDGQESTSRLLRNKSFLENQDESANAIRISLDSLLFHKLEYSTFEELYSEFEAVLHVLYSTVKDISFDSLSLRYINSLHLPSKRSEFRVEDYLNYKLELPFSTSNIFLQFSVMNKEDNEMTGFVIQTTRKARDPSVDDDPGLFLDINVQKEVQLNNEQSEEIKDVFFKMRDFKNSIFFTVVQPDILETYK